MSTRIRMKIASDERGQASLMIGMMMMTFILLFAFVVNTGMLVNAKINLQNAADLAAYSGAAVQARLLNDISYLNYEMRRQYKKFLFRYYVVGNMAAGSFPRPGGVSSGTSPKWGPGPLDSSLLYGVPAVCVAFSTTGPEDNYCQTGILPGISIPSSNNWLSAFDAINTTLTQELTAIEAIRETNCGKIGAADSSLLLLWLFNTSPDLQSLQTALNSAGSTDQDLRAILQISESAAQGLGLVPRELILHERIKTLESYVNAPKQTKVTISTVNNLTSSIDPASNERTIQAFLSAYDTLGNHTFGDDTQISMDELLPGDSDQATLLQLNDLKANFDAYSVQFQLQNNATNSKDCAPVMAPVSVSNVPLGVAKDPTVLTFYAIRLQAQAQVLFSPWGAMQLTAYAAARPFGSRIGPASADFTMAGSATAPLILSPPQTVGQIPNLPMTQEDEGLGPGKGWDNNTVLGSLYSQFFPGGQMITGAALENTNFENGTRSAMVPNPIEGNQYNIPNDLPDPFVTNFDSLNQMSFWAPIISPANISNLKTVLAGDLAQIMNNPSTQPGNTIADSTASSSLIGALTGDIYKYVEDLQSGQGEILAGSPDGSGKCNPSSCIQEGVNIAHVQNPFVLDSGQPIQLGSSIMIEKTVPNVKTSYVTTNDPAFTSQGRVGYSVKFVSFDSLTKTGTDATGSGQIVKPSGFLDSQAEKDTLQIQH